MNPTIVLAGLAFVSFALTGAGFAGGWFLKPDSLKGKVIMVGRRPSAGTGVIKAIKPIRGVYTHQEKGDYSADIHLDNAFLWDDKMHGCKFVDVDLDSAHPIRFQASGPEEAMTLTRLPPDDPDTRKLVLMPVRYTGQCVNDDDKVTVKRKDGSTVELKSVWRRLTGERLYSIRKDIRMKQLAAIGTGIWDFLVRVMPICLILIGLVLLIILGMMGYSLVHHG